MKETARFFKVLADEARLQMLWLLYNHKELCVCDIMEVLDITQSKASRHLAALRNAGLVTDRREGLWSYYSLCPIGNDVAAGHMKLLRESLSRRADSKPLLAKLHAWLKAKKSSEGCQTHDAAARAGRNAKRDYLPTHLSGETR